MIKSLSALAGLLLLGACAGTPPTEVFTLQPSSDRSVTPSPTDGPLIVVDTVEVAEYADRTQMVTRRGDYRISLHEFAVWSEPPGALIAASLVDDLARRFGDDRVMTTPLPLYERPDWRIEASILRFDVDPTGEAVIDARWTLLEGPEETLVETKRQKIVTQATSAEDPTARVVALREALAILADSIAERIAAGP